MNGQRRIENVLKRLKLTNYRKFSSEKNIVEFISSKIVLNQDNFDNNDNFVENSIQNDCEEIDIASDTTLIIGKNNAGKTTIITALDNLINHSLDAFKQSVDRDGTVYLD